jgi:hypothetical protein
MKHPARLAHGGWILGAVLGLTGLPGIPGRAQTQDTLPSGVSVRLETKDGRTNYLMGEPIVMQLILSGDRSDYVVNTVRTFGVGETINVTPADQIFRWHGTVSGDVVVVTSLSTSGTSINILLNDAIVIKKPGRYSISVTTKRIAQADLQKGLTLTSNPVTISVAPMPEQEEANRLAVLSEAIAKADHLDGLDHPTEVRLACLEGDQAARKKVELYLTGRDDIVGIRKTGLALSRNKELELKLLDEAWRSLERVPDQYFLDEMILLRHLKAAVPVPDSGMMAPSYSKDEVIRAQAETAPYISEIIATMAQREGANRSATQAFLDEVKKQNDFELRMAN